MGWSKEDQEKERERIFIMASLENLKGKLDFVLQSNHVNLGGLNESQKTDFPGR
jgi:hypothetical protein